MDPTLDPTLVQERVGEANTPQAPVPEAQDRAQGDVLDGRYRLRARLGRGGFGDVWRAEELLPDGAPFREVALKLLVSDFADAADWAQEAKLLASFRHPSLVTIYAAGILQQPPHSPFVSMELLEGCSFADLLRHRGRIPWRRVLAWAQDAAGALDVIHARGVVHLDLKPANLFLTQDGALKVLDFGISRRSGTPTSRRADIQAVSQRGLDLATAAFMEEQAAYAPTRRDDRGGNAGQYGVIGTPGYMAPEILEMADPTAATDAYALAVCMVQLATGTMPQAVGEEPKDWTDLHQLTTWWSDLRNATLRGAMRDLSLDAANLPNGLLLLLEQLLSVDPAHRKVTPGKLKPMLDAVWERPHGVIDPYPGLKPLTAENEGLLFGRDDDIARLGRELEFEPCILLEGPRGSGKTSLARAGLVPHLARRWVDHKEDWVEVPLSPGDDPEKQLTEALGQVAPELAEASLESIFAWCGVSNIGLVLVVDPMDALISHISTDHQPPTVETKSAADSRPSSANVSTVEDPQSTVDEKPTVDGHESKETPDSTARDVDDAMRDTVLDVKHAVSGRLAGLLSTIATGGRFQGLRVVGVLGEGKTKELLATPVGAPLRAALRFIGLPATAAARELVVGPARLAGADVRDVDQVVAEVRQELRGAGFALPFVSLALAMWWKTAERTEGGLVLRGERWAKLGGVQGAIARHADAALQAHPAAARMIADEVLLRLGTVDGTRVSWPEGELVEALGSADDTLAILKALEQVYLVRRHAGWVEVGHDALLSNWPHLVALRGFHLQRLILFERLREAADSWERAGNHKDFLLRGELLDDVSKHRTLLARGLPSRQRDIIQESVRRTRWRKVAKLGLAAVVGLVLASVLTGRRMLKQQQADAEAEKRVAEQRADVAEIIGKSRRTEDPFHRAAWMIQAMEREAPDWMLPLDLATTANNLARSHFLTLDPVTGAALPWNARWVVGGAPGGTLIIGDLQPPEPVVFDNLELDAEPDSASLPLVDPRVFALRPHADPETERLPFTFDTAFVSRSVTGEVRVFRLQEDGSVALVALAPMRCSGALRIAEAAPVVACPTNEGIARWDLGTATVDHHAFQGNVLDVSPHGSLVAATLGRRVLLWEPHPMAALSPFETELQLPAPPILGRFSPRDRAIALVQAGRTSIYEVDTEGALLWEMDTASAPAAARWDAAGVDLGVCSANGLGSWYYLRKGGRAKDDPPPTGSPCVTPVPDQPSHLRTEGEVGTLAERDLGSHSVRGGWKLPDGRVLTRDLVLFTPGPPAAKSLLSFQGRDMQGQEEDRLPRDSAVAILRDDNTIVWQIGDEVRLYKAADGHHIQARKGNLLRRCPDDRFLAWRPEQTSYRILDAQSDATFATIPRTPSFVLGINATCTTFVIQELDGNIVAYSIALGRRPEPRTVAVTDGYVFDVRPSAARGDVGSALLLAFSSGAIARMDDATGEVRLLGYATPVATALADGPEPGDVVFADASGIVLIRRSGTMDRLMESIDGVTWEDLSVAQDGNSMLLASAEKVAVLDLERREILGSMPSEGHERFATWDAEGSVLLWSFDRVGGTEGFIVPRGLGLARQVAASLSNLGVVNKRLVVK